MIFTSNWKFEQVIFQQAIIDDPDFSDSFRIRLILILLLKIENRGLSQATLSILKWSETH